MHFHNYTTISIRNFLVIFEPICDILDPISNVRLWPWAKNRDPLPPSPSLAHTYIFLFHCSGKRYTVLQHQHLPPTTLPIGNRGGGGGGCRARTVSGYNEKAPYSFTVPLPLLFLILALYVCQLWTSFSGLLFFSPRRSRIHSETRRDDRTRRLMEYIMMRLAVLRRLNRYVCMLGSQGTRGVPGHGPESSRPP